MVGGTRRSAPEGGAEPGQVPVWWVRPEASTHGQNRPLRRRKMTRRHLPQLYDFVARGRRCNPDAVGAWPSVAIVTLCACLPRRNRLWLLAEIRQENHMIDETVGHGTAACAQGGAWVEFD